MADAIWIALYLLVVTLVKRKKPTEMWAFFLTGVCPYCLVNFAVEII